MLDFRPIFNAILVRGIIFGFVAAVIGLVFFYRTLSQQFAGQQLIITYRPFFLRFIEGTVIGIAAVVLIVALLYLGLYLLARPQ